VHTQRGKKDQLTPERRQRLESLQGWTWDSDEAQWKEGFAALQQFVNEEGHARVTKRYKSEDGYALGTWVQHRRRNKNRLTPERKQQLESLDGWVWKMKS